jgi:hypothetical protein
MPELVPVLVDPELLLERELLLVVPEPLLLEVEPRPLEPELAPLLLEPAAPLI